jgi:hypothetical protein
MLLDDLPPAAVTALLAVAGPGTGSPLLSVEFRHFGAALGEAPAQAGALASIDAAFGMYAVGMAVTPELKQAINDRIDRLSEALSPWRSHHGYFNFDDRRGDAEGLFPHATYRRLRSIKAAYDPGDLFVSNHPVIPGADGR